VGDDVSARLDDFIAPGLAIILRGRLRSPSRGCHDRADFAILSSRADGSPERFARLASPLERDALHFVDLAGLRFRYPIRSKPCPGS
jgi:hypothetical protein